MWKKRSKDLKNMDIRKALADAEMKLSDLARVMNKEPDQIYHLLWYRELTQNEKDGILKAIKKYHRQPDQVISTVRVRNLPEQIESGWMVCRPNMGRLWYYGIYDTEDRAFEVSVELGNGVILEVSA